MEAGSAQRTVLLPTTAEVPVLVHFFNASYIQVSTIEAEPLAFFSHFSH
jgi:hypothetical protein